MLVVKKCPHAGMQIPQFVCIFPKGGKLVEGVIEDHKYFWLDTMGLLPKVRWPDFSYVVGGW